MFWTVLKEIERWGVRRIFWRKKMGREEALCMRWRSKTFQEKKKEKKEKWAQGFSVSSLGFQPGVREVRRCATSVVSLPNFRKSFINLSSTLADNPKNLKSQQTSIEEVRSASTIERALQRASTREEPFRSGALCRRSTKVGYTVWLYYDDQILPTMIKLW